MDGKDAVFSKQRNGDAIHIWNQSTITLLDIRHNLILPEEAIRSYRTPASTFIYTIGNRADVSLNDVFYKVERFGLFHCSKGTELSISPMNDWLEYYMVFYKAGEPSFNKKEYLKLLDQGNPFRQQYGFMPDNPIFFANLLRKMYEGWKGPTPLTLFYGKSAFYQIVYEIYEELDKGNIHILEPDIVAMAKRYLDEHYSIPVSIQAISEVLNISASQLHRRFTAQHQISPQEYLIQTRLSNAKKYLSQTSMTIKEIAKACGFADEFSFMRTFKKTCQMTATAYREINTYPMRDFAMDNHVPFLYNENHIVRQDKQSGRGYTMFSRKRNTAVLAAVVSLMLMLSACSPASTNTGSSEPTQVVETEVQNMETGTRIISTVMGDIEVPANPQRVIYAGLVGDMIALGVLPVATGDATGRAYEKEVAGLPVFSALEAEEIMSYNPDLIIVIAEAAYEIVSKVAPTIVIPFTELTMEERITFLGEVLNKEDEAKKALADFDEKIANAKELLEGQGLDTKTFSIFEADSDGFYVFGDKWGRGGDIIYNYLGLKAPEIIQSEIIGKDQSRDISMEVINEYAGDYIFFSGDVTEISDNPVWNALPAVQSGDIIFL